MTKWVTNEAKRSGGRMNDRARRSAASKQLVRRRMIWNFDL